MLMSKVALLMALTSYGIFAIINSAINENLWVRRA